MNTDDLRSSLFPLLPRIPESVGGFIEVKKERKKTYKISVWRYKFSGYFVSKDIDKYAEVSPFLLMKFADEDRDLG